MKKNLLILGVAALLGVLPSAATEQDDTLFNLGDILTPLMPKTDIFTPAENNGYGMNMVVWKMEVDIDKFLDLNTSVTDSCTLCKDGEPVLCFSLGYRTDIMEWLDVDHIDVIVSCICFYFRNADLGFDPASAPGVYTITLPEGAVVYDDKKSAKFSKTYIMRTDGVLVSPEVEFAPAEGSLSEAPSVVSIVFKDASNLSYGGNGAATIVLPDNTSVTSQSPKAADGVAVGSDECKALAWTFSSLATQPGEYTFIVPAKTLNVNDPHYDGSEALSGNVDVISAKWFVAEPGGIVSLGIDNNGKYNVSTLAGVAVITGGTEEDVAGLAPGIYIINGRKVLLQNK